MAQVTMTEAQRIALQNLCERYGVQFVPSNFRSTFDLPRGYVAGWVSNLYVGCAPDGSISS